MWGSVPVHVHIYTCLRVYIGVCLPQLQAVPNRCTDRAGFGSKVPRSEREIRPPSPKFLSPYAVCVCLSPEGATFLWCLLLWFGLTAVRGLFGPRLYAAGAKSSVPVECRNGLHHTCAKVLNAMAERDAPYRSESEMRNFLESSSL